VDLRDEILEWSMGVVSGLEPDAIPAQALVRADNAEFTSVAGQRAVIRSRRGLTTVNRTPLSETSAGVGPAVVALGMYPYRSGGSQTRYLVAALANGDVHLLLDDGAAATHTPTASFTGLLTNNCSTVDMTVIGNRLFLVDNLGGQASLLGTQEVDWGTAAVTGLALVASGAGSMTGDYDVLVTGYNTQTGAESDISDAVSVTGLTADGLQVTVNAVAVGLTHRFFRVYLRKPVLGSGFYRVTAGTGYNSTHQAFPLYAAGATTNTVIDVSDATLTAAVIEPPPDSKRGLPPSGIKAVVSFANRLFAIDDTRIYWSELDLPDAWDPESYEPLTPSNAGILRNLEPAYDRLYIRSCEARFVLTGSTDPRTWSFDLIDTDVGCCGVHAYTEHDNRLFWWDSKKGPMMQEGPDSLPQGIGQELIADSLDAVQQVSRALIQFAAVGGHVVMLVPDVVSSSRLTRGYVFNTRVMKWESTDWDPMELASIGVCFDGDSVARLYVGNHNGQIFRLLDGNNDGVVDGTSRGTFTAASAAPTTITDATATFDTTGAGLRERMVTVLDSTGQQVGRERIASNTGTVLTLGTALAGLAVGETYTYLIGGPNWIVETYWGHMGAPFLKKRFDRLWMQFRTDIGTAELTINTRFNWDALRRTASATASLESSLWDEATWDESSWAGNSVVTQRLFLYKTGTNYSVQLRNPYPDQGVTLLKLHVLAHGMSDRYASI
jgi:hypothetical protein